MNSRTNLRRRVRQRARKFHKRLWNVGGLFVVDHERLFRDRGTRFGEQEKLRRKKRLRVGRDHLWFLGFAGSLSPAWQAWPGDAPAACLLSFGFSKFQRVE